jgi:hypothetical protein
VGVPNCWLFGQIVVDNVQPIEVIIPNEEAMESVVIPINLTNYANYKGGRGGGRMPAMPD